MTPYWSSNTSIMLLLFLVIAMTLGFLPSPASTSTPRSATRGVLGMFTGIVEEMGTVVSLQERQDMPLWDGTTGTGTELVVQGDVVMKDAYLG
jgi:hypothetical protein